MERQSDENHLIGKLQRQLINCKQETRELKNKIEKLQDEYEQMETKARKLEQHIDHRNADIFRVKAHYRSSLATRDRHIVELQSRVSHGLSLKQAE